MSDRRPSTPDPRTDVGIAADPPDARQLERLRDLAVEAQRSQVHFFVSHAAHFFDPLVPAEFESLRDAALGPAVVQAAARVAAEVGRDDAPRIYFPVPMARSLESGANWSEVEGRFRYDMIRVDEEQRWTWRGRPVADRTREFFSDHLGWQPAVSRWFFEYKIHDGWWDKSYLEATITPLRGLRFEIDGADPPRVVLLNGQRVECRVDTLRLDRRERLYVQTPTMGEVLIAEPERFRILRTADEDLETVELGDRRVRLQWPSAE